MESNESSVAAMEMVEQQAQKLPKFTTKTMKGKEIMEEEEDEDRTSWLSDCILIEIISRLDSTKQAIRTGTLSKRWKNLWPQVPSLVFSSRDRGNLSLSEYFLVLEKTLTQCRQPRLNKFQLYINYTLHLKSKINNWIRYAVSRNVQELTVIIWANKALEVAFRLDQFFFTSSCFTRLNLEYCLLNPTGAISWNKLKSLSIKYVELDEGLIQNILSGSPLLETLELVECYGFQRIDITSKSVKNLVISEYGCSANILEIDAPNVLSVTIQVNLWLGKVLLLNVPSAVKADLDYCNSLIPEWYKEEEEKMLEGLLLSLGHVEELKIGKTCLKALFRLEAKGFVFPSCMMFPDVTSPDFFDSDSSTDSDSGAISDSQSDG